MTSAANAPTWAVFVALAALFCVQTRDGPRSWAEASRLAAIQSLAERGTQRIDESPLAAVTKDKVLIGGHYYCDKPPLLQVLGAVPYAVLHYGAGVTLETGACRGAGPCAYRWLTFLMVGLPAALALALFFAGARRLGLPHGPALALTALLAFGTMMWPYSLVFNNHVPAAAGLLGCFLVLAESRDEGRPSRLAATGLLGGLAIGFDLMTVLPVAGLGIVLALRDRRGALAFALGCTLPLLVTALADLEISGSVLPPYFAPHGYRYPGSPFSDSAGALRPPASVAAYTFQGLVGDRGLLAYSPVLLWGIAGLARLAFERRHALWPEALAAALASLAFAAYIFTRTDAHGGKAYGERYFLSLVPLLMLFAVFTWPPRRPWLFLAALAVAAPLSVVSAWQGVQRTWTVTPPVLYLDARRLGVCSSLAPGHDPCRGPWHDQRQGHPRKPRRHPVGVTRRSMAA